MTDTATLRRLAEAATPLPPSAAFSELLKLAGEHGLTVDVRLTGAEAVEDTDD